MTDDIFNPEYDDNKFEDVIYLRSIWEDSFGNKHRKTEMLFDEGLNIREKHIEDDDDGASAVMKIIKEIPIEITKTGQQKIVCDLVSYRAKDWQRGFLSFKIARRTSKGVYGNQEITLTMPNALKICKFMYTILQSEDIFNPQIKKIQFDTPNFANITIDKEDFEKIVENNKEYLKYYDSILTIKMRERAIEKLRSIVYERKYSNETEITRFLKENTWLFNSEYVFFSSNGKIDCKNIADLLPVNLESFVDIVEVKLPTEKLFNFDNSHNNFYPSGQLTKAIAQTQNYIYQLEQTATRKNNKGYKVVRPHAFILIGSTPILTSEEEKYLRILNASYHNITIISYQQLLNRAENLLKISKEK